MTFSRIRHTYLRLGGRVGLGLCAQSLELGVLFHYTTRLGGGALRVGVHIADVAHFVRPGTALDAEAAARATSTYLVDRVVPMLPRPLCEDACSLNPGAERLAFSVVWVMGEEDAVVRCARAALCAALALRWRSTSRVPFRLFMCPPAQIPSRAHHLSQFRRSPTPRQMKLAGRPGSGGR